MQSDVIVVGAGPTGLTLANLLATAGIRVTVFEAKAEPDVRMRAIGVTPPSLEILDRFGLGGTLAQHGVAIRRAEVFGDRRLLGTVGFDGIHPRYPFILSVPQYRTERLLREAADASSLIRIVFGAEVTSVEGAGPTPGAGRSRRRSDAAGDPALVPNAAGDEPFAGRSDAAGDPAAAGTSLGTSLGASVGTSLGTSLGASVGLRDGRRVTAPVVCLCTGTGGLRPFPIARRKRYRRRFLIGDYRDTSRLGDIVRLYFSRDGSVESFPLPDGMRRWIVQLTGSSRHSRLDEANASSLLATLVAERTGIRLPAGTPHWWSSFRPERCELLHLARRCVFVAGDAAHSMSPIGGQGMNTGIADAELAADLIVAGATDGAVRTPVIDTVTMDTLRANMPSCTRLYEKVRRRAARCAARRAAVGMFVGTTGGVPGSAIRNALLRAGLTLIPDRAIASHFGMLTIPGHRSPGSFTASTLSSMPK